MVLGLWFWAFGVVWFFFLGKGQGGDRGKAAPPVVG